MVSGSLKLITDVWSSGNLVTDTDIWIHFYVGALTNLLGKYVGDWTDGFFFTGAYQVQFQPAKVGGLGFVQMARLICTLHVSRN